MITVTRDLQNILRYAKKKKKTYSGELFVERYFHNFYSHKTAQV